MRRVRPADRYPESSFIRGRFRPGCGPPSSGFAVSRCRPGLVRSGLPADQTGIDGLFNFDLKWAPDETERQLGPAPPAGTNSPDQLPSLFAARKVSATACVVGAIIGELPASIQDGLGGAILNFNQYYASAPTRLWATNLVAAALGIAFYLAIAGVEKLVVRKAPEHVA